jgi:hypothetical protein
VPSLVCVLVSGSDEVCPFAESAVGWEYEFYTR